MVDATEKDLQQDRELAAIRGSVSALSSRVTSLEQLQRLIDSDLARIKARPEVTLGRLIARALGFR